MAIRHEIRKWNGTRTVDLTPVKAIRYKCLAVDPENRTGVIG